MFIARRTEVEESFGRLESLRREIANSGFAPAN
jgi:hypothetical protein